MVIHVSKFILFFSFISLFTCFNMRLNKIILNHVFKFFIEELSVTKICNVLLSNSSLGQVKRKLSFLLYEPSYWSLNHSFVKGFDKIALWFKARFVVLYRTGISIRARYGTGLPGGTSGHTERYTLVYRIIFYFFSYCSNATV